MGAGWERHKRGIVRPFRRLLKGQVRGVGNYGDEVKTGFLKTEGCGTPGREDAIQVSGLGHWVSGGALH